METKLISWKYNFVILCVILWPHLRPWVGGDLREPELSIIRVHLPNLLSRRGPQHFDNLDELIDARVAGKDGLAEEEFGEDAAGGPDI